MQGQPASPESQCLLALSPPLLAPGVCYQEELSPSPFISPWTGFSSSVTSQPLTFEGETFVLKILRLLLVLLCNDFSYMSIYPLILQGCCIVIALL